jgi:hypothetical protein
MSFSKIGHDFPAHRKENSCLSQSAGHQDDLIQRLFQENPKHFERKEWVRDLTYEDLTILTQADSAR